MHELAERERLLQQLEDVRERLRELDKSTRPTDDGAAPDGRPAPQLADDAHLRILRERSPTVFWTTDADLKLTTVAGAGLENIEPSPDGALGLTLAEFLKIEEPQSAAMQKHTAALDGHSGSCELSWSGRVFHMFVEPLRDHSSAIVGTVGVALDFTDQRLAEDSLRRSESRFRALFDNSHDVIAMFSPEGSLMYVSPSIERVLGLSPEELTRETPLERVHPDDREEADKGFLACLQEPGSTVHMVHRLRHHDGSYRTVEITGTNLLHLPGMNAMVSVFRDITDRVQAETKLRESEQRFRAIFNSTFQFIGLLSIDGILLEANETALAFGGLRAEDVLNRPFWETSWWQGDAARVQQLKDAIASAAGGEFVRYKVEVDGAESAEVIDFSIKPVFDEHGVVRLLLPEGRVITEQERMEAALRASENRFHRLIEHAPDAVVLLDAESGRFEASNAAAQELFKLTPDQMCEYGLCDLSPPMQPCGRSSEEMSREYIEQVYQGKISAYEWTHQDREGREIPCEVRLLPLDVDGRTVVWANLTDISGRRRVDNAIRSIAEGVATESDVAFFELLAGSLAEAFEMSCAVVGRIEQGEQPRVETIAIVVEGQPKPSLSYELQGTPCGTVIRTEAPHICDDVQAAYPDFADRFGETYTSYAGAPLVDPAGKVNGVIAILGLQPFKDHRVVESMLRVFSLRASSELERQRTAAELQQTRAILGAAIEASPAGIIIADAPDVTIRAVNSAALNIRGAPVSELTNIPAELHPQRWRCFHPDGTPFDPTELPLSRAVLQGKISRNIDVIIERTDGHRQWVLGNAAPVRDQDGNIVAGVVVFPDITEKREAEEALRKRESELAHVVRVSTMGEMVAGIAHELKQPLYAIQNFGTACRVSLNKEDYDKSQLLEWLDEITSTAEYAGDVLLRLRAFVQREDENREVVDLTETIDTSIALAQNDLQRRSVTITREFPTQTPYVNVDSVQIQQVLVNLIRNAIEALQGGSDTDPKIAINVKTGSEMVTVAVSDNGPGLPPAGDIKLFDAFQSTRSGGMGLGLAISKTIVESHGGSITAESGEAGGAVFRFQLPLSN